MNPLHLFWIIPLTMFLTVFAMCLCQSAGRMSRAEEVWADNERNIDKSLDQYEIELLKGEKIK